MRANRIQSFLFSLVSFFPQKKLKRKKNVEKNWIRCRSVDACGDGVGAGVGVRVGWGI